MRISDWSSDVCSSDLFLLADEAPEVEAGAAYQQTGHVEAGHVDQVAHRGAAVQAGGEGNLAAATDRRAIEQPDEPGRVGRRQVAGAVAMAPIVQVLHQDRKSTRLNSSH